MQIIILSPSAEMLIVFGAVVIDRFPAHCDRFSVHGGHSVSSTDNHLSSIALQRCIAVFIFDIEPWHSHGRLKHGRLKHGRLKHG